MQAKTERATRKLGKRADKSQACKEAVSLGVSLHETSRLATKATRLLAYRDMYAKNTQYNISPTLM